MKVTCLLSAHGRTIRCKNQQKVTDLVVTIKLHAKFMLLRHIIIQNRNNTYPYPLPLFTNMAVDLIVDFPLQRNHQVVRFAERAQLHIVERHEDDEDKNKLWYTKSDYNSMKRKLKQYVLQARANDASSEEEDSGFWIGIEAKTCRFRCVRAVLEEQARQAHLQVLDGRILHLLC